MGNEGSAGFEEVITCSHGPPTARGHSQKDASLRSTPSPSERNGIIVPFKRGVGETIVHILILCKYTCSIIIGCYFEILFFFIPYVSLVIK